MELYCGAECLSQDRWKSFYLFFVLALAGTALLLLLDNRAGDANRLEQRSGPARSSGRPGFFNRQGPRRNFRRGPVYTRQAQFRSAQFEHAHVELVVLALLLEQVVVVAALDDAAVFEH